MPGEEIARDSLQAGIGGVGGLGRFDGGNGTGRSHQAF